MLVAGKILYCSTKSNDDAKSLTGLLVTPSTDVERIISSIVEYSVSHQTFGQLCQVRILLVGEVLAGPPSKLTTCWGKAPVHTAEETTKIDDTNSLSFITLSFVYIYPIYPFFLLTPLFFVYVSSFV